MFNVTSDTHTRSYVNIQPHTAMSTILSHATTSFTVTQIHICIQACVYYKWAYEKSMKLDDKN